MGQPLPIQPPCRLKGGLADVAGTLPMSWGADGWNWGVSYTPVCKLDRFVWNCDSFALQGEKPINDIEDSVDFDMTTLGVVVNCGPNGENTPIGDIARYIAEQGLERYMWSDLALVLAAGDVGTATLNPSLQSTAILALGLNLVDPSGILATLQGLIEQTQNCWCADIVFHVPAQFLPMFVSLHIVEWDDVRNVWHMGPYDFSFDTYPNLGTPAAELAEPTVQDGGEVWIYATSRPLAAFGPPEVITSRHNRQNEYLALAEIPAIIVFNPCCVFAAKARICP